MNYKEFRKINVYNYLSDNGFKINFRKVGAGNILKYCPICRGKDHFIIFNDNNMHSYNGCFKGGDIIELNSCLFGLSKRDSINQLKEKYFNILDTRNTTTNKRLMTINVPDNIDNGILNFMDKEIQMFLIDISQGYRQKSDKSKKIIDKIMQKLLNMSNSIERYDYIQYLKIIKYEKKKEKMKNA